MSQDHIVDEVRAVREEIGREHDYKLESIFAMLRRSAESSLRHRASPPTLLKEFDDSIAPDSRRR